MDKLLPILYILLIMLPLISIPGNTLYLTPYTSSTGTYVFNMVWSKTLSGIRSNITFVAGDINNDGYNDIMVTDIDPEHPWRVNSIYVLSGVDGTTFNHFSINGNITGLAVINDINGNGYRDIVLIETYTDTVARQTTVEYIVWDPYSGQTIREKNTTVETTGYGGYSVPIFNIVVTGSIVKSAYGYMNFTAQGMIIKTYIVSYNIEQDTISVDTVDNQFYIMYTNQMMGDLDNDGVLEIGTEYTYISYMSMTGFLPSFGLKLYRDGTLLFTKTFTDKLPLIAGITNNGEETVLWIYEAYFSFFGTSENKMYLSVYRLDGTQLFSKEFENIALSTFLDLGEYHILGYVTEDNITYIDLYSMVNGSRIFHLDMGNETLVTEKIVGLGDVDGDSYREVLIGSTTNNYILKTEPNPLLYPVTCFNENTSYSLLSVLEAPDNNYLVTIEMHDNYSVVKTYSISYQTIVDNTPPVIDILKPENNTLIPQLLQVEAYVYDNESGIKNIEAYLYNLDTGENTSLTIMRTPLRNGYRVNAYYFFPESSSGNYSLTIIAWNNADMETKETIYFKVDAVSPEVTIWCPEYGEAYNVKDLPITVNFTVEDENLKNWSLIINDEIVMNGTSPGNYIFNLTSDYLVPGINYIFVTAYDEAGNFGLDMKTIYYFDGPFKFKLTIENEFDLYGYLSNNITLQLRLDGYSDVDIEYYKVYIGSHEYYLTLQYNETVTETIDISSLPDDVYNFSIVIRPLNYDEYVLYQGVIFIDNYAPKLNISLPLIEGGIIDLSKVSEKIGNKVKFTISLSAEDRFLEGVKVIVDGNIVFEYTEIVIVLSTTNNIAPLQSSSLPSISKEATIELEEGEHDVTVSAYDEAGHSTNNTYHVIVDLTPPTIESFTLNSSGNNLTIYYKVYDELSGVSKVVISINGTEYVYNDTEKTITFTNMSNGTYIVVLKAYDKAGLENTMEKTITIGAVPQPPSNTTTPSPPTTSPPSTTTKSPTATPGATTKPSKTTSPTKTTTGGGIPGTLIAAIVIVIIVVVIAVWFMKKT